MPLPEWSVEARVVELPLAERFTIARESWDVARNVFAMVRYGDAYGVGEVQPESPEAVVEEIQNLDLSLLRGPFDLESVGDLLPAGAARSVLDIALHDLAGKLAGLSIRELLGLGNRPRPQTSVTVPIGDLDEMVSRATKLADYPIIKTKVGFDGDVEAIAAIRQVFTGTLRVDANEGWTVEEATDRLNGLHAFDIELCEQPIARGDFEGLRRLRDASPIPIFADEDVTTSADVAALGEVVDGVNLKLRKAGGIRETVKAASVARAHGMKVMLGCDLESGIAATAGAQVAALMDLVDLDGPLLLAHDPHPGVGYDGGRLVLPDGPGLGVEALPW